MSKYEATVRRKNSPLTGKDRNSFRKLQERKEGQRDEQE